MDDIFTGSTPDNYNEARGRKLSPSLNSSRDTSIVSLTSSSIPYYKKMERNNNIDINNNNNVSPELSYKTSQKKEICLRSAAKNQDNMLPSQDNLTNNTIVVTTTYHKDKRLHKQ